MLDNFKGFNFKDPMFGTVGTLSVFSGPKEEKPPKDVMEERINFAPVHDPYSFVHRVQTDHKGKDQNMAFKKGTTTVGFRYKDGIIIAVDSRASGGEFVMSESVRKIIEINDYLLGTMAGGAADCQFWQSYLNFQCRLYELANGERISVNGASKILYNIMFERGRGLSMGVMVAGVDKSGTRLFYLDNDGTRIEGDVFAVGSGGTYALGVIDANRTPDMELEAAIELGKMAIYHATHRDTGSGGVVRVYHIHKDGWTNDIDAMDVNKLHWEIQEKKKQ